MSAFFSLCRAPPSPLLGDGSGSRSARSYLCEHACGELPRAAFEEKSSRTWREPWCCSSLQTDSPALATPKGATLSSSTFLSGWWWGPIWQRILGNAGNAAKLPHTEGKEPLASHRPRNDACGRCTELASEIAFCFSGSLHDYAK